MILADKPDLPLPIYNGTESYNIAHISDLHIDFEYLEGMNSACDEPMCCRAHNGPGMTNATKAGKWGAYHNCDVPTRTLKAALNDLKK
jgi:sphingomyelin phosphodiesterase